MTSNTSDDCLDLPVPKSTYSSMCTDLKETAFKEVEFPSSSGTTLHTPVATFLKWASGYFQYKNGIKGPNNGSGPEYTIYPPPPIIFTRHTREIIDGNVCPVSKPTYETGCISGIIFDLGMIFFINFYPKTNIIQWRLFKKVKNGMTGGDVEIFDRLPLNYDQHALKSFMDSYSKNEKEIFANFCCENYIRTSGQVLSVSLSLTLTYLFSISAKNHPEITSFYSGYPLMLSASFLKDVQIPTLNESAYDSWQEELFPLVAIIFTLDETFGKHEREHKLVLTGKPHSRQDFEKNSNCKYPFFISLGPSPCVNIDDGLKIVSNNKTIFYRKGVRLWGNSINFEFIQYIAELNSDDTKVSLTHAIIRSIWLDTNSRARARSIQLREEEETRNNDRKEKLKAFCVEKCLYMVKQITKKALAEIFFQLPPEHFFGDNLSLFNETMDELSTQHEVLFKPELQNGTCYIKVKLHVLFD
jgi:hypothetical protein